MYTVENSMTLSRSVTLNEVYSRKSSETGKAPEQQSAS